MRWPWQRREQPKNLVSISDPALAALFSIGTNFTGVPVSEPTVLGLSAVWRAVSIIAGTIAGLPLRTLRDVDGIRTRVGSFLDNPAGPLGAAGPTPYEWRETVLLHLLLHGNAFLAHVRNEAGGLAGLVPIHPLAVSIDEPPQPLRGQLPPLRRTYTATLSDGTRRGFTPETMTHIPALSSDGVRGLSPIAVARNSLGKSIAADRAAAKMYSDGALMAGMVTPEDDVTDEDAATIRNQLTRTAGGWENATQLAVVNRRLKFTPWTMSLEDAQFLQSRQFEIEEIARWYGIPPHLLMQTEKQTSWGTGVAEQNRGLARFTLDPWTRRIEQRLSRLLPAPRFVEFDFAELLRPSPEVEIPLLIQQVNEGIITPNEMRRIRNMDPVPGGDVLRGPRPAQPVGEPEPQPAGVPG